MKEKKPAWTLNIPPVHLSKEEEEELIEIRSTQTHNLLAKLNEQGIWLYDRKARIHHHLLTWEQMRFPKSK